MFISSHHDGSILILDKERDDAPFVPEEDLQIISPVTRKGVRQVQLRLRKSIRSKNQKSNPVAVYKATKKRINGIECSPDGRFVGLVSEDGTLRIIDLMKEEYVQVLKPIEATQLTMPQINRRVHELLRRHDMPCLVTRRQIHHHGRPR